MRVESTDVLQMISDVYWFTLEYGVLDEAGTPKAYGAALLSSSGETCRLRRARIRPLDIRTMPATEYVVSGYQPVLFSARSLDEVTETLGNFLSALDDGRRASDVPRSPESCAVPEPRDGFAGRSVGTRAREATGITEACRKRPHAPRSTRSSPRSTPRTTAM
ncbi:hypothetical protein ACFYWD_11925 [Streptomyces sp. NPDC003781]|uniref:hypothetical protein n=1 Tax=Streptomyces sp. NPDC003781 TaxID=3364686 RepID=UPI0036C90DFB